VTRRSPLPAVLAACLAYALLQSLALPTLPTMTTTFDVGTETTVWVVLAFLLTSCSASPILGALGDRVGRRRMLQVSLLAFLTGSLVSGFALSMPMVIGGRALQGVGGAVFPLAFSVIGSDLPRHRVGMALGLVSSSFSVGGVVGLPLGGLLMDGLGWRWCYYLPAGLAVVALVLVQRSVRQGVSKEKRPIDVVGGVLVAGWLTALLLGITFGARTGWTSALTVALLGAAVLIFAAWIAVELRVVSPLIDVALLARAPAPLASLAALATGWVQIGVISLLPVHLGAASGLDLTASQVGLLYVPGFVVGMIVAPIGGTLGGRYGYRRVLLTGLALAGGSLVLPATVDEPWAYVVFLALAMSGVTMAFSALPGLLVTSLPSDVAGGITGMNTVFRSIGGAVGAQVGATLMGASGSIETYLWVSVAVMAFSLVVSIALRTQAGSGTKKATRD
jgi:MFS family permease